MPKENPENEGVLELLSITHRCQSGPANPHQKPSIEYISVIEEFADPT